MTPERRAPTAFFRHAAIRSLVSVAALVMVMTPARAAEVDVVVGLHGATFLPWEATDETGNGFGVTAGINLSDFRLLAGLGAILPASVADGRFAVLWCEAQWHPFRAMFAAWGLPLSPYGLVGLGVGMPDDYADGSEPAPAGSIRWVSGEPQFLGIAGLGIAVGEFDGFFVGADVRLYNVSYAGFVVTAGHAF
jgi:hypothetical protein